LTGAGAEKEIKQIKVGLMRQRLSK